MSRLMSKRVMDCDSIGYEKMAAVEKRNLICTPTEIEEQNEANRKYELEDSLRQIGDRIARNYPFDDYRIYLKDLETYGHPLNVDGILEELTRAGWSVGIVSHSNPQYFQLTGSL